MSPGRRGGLVPVIYRAWANRVSLTAGIAAAGAAVSYVGPAQWRSSGALTIPLMVAPAWLWALGYAAVAALVLGGAAAGARQVRAAGHAVGVIVYVVFAGSLLVAWVVTLVQWLGNDQVDAVLPYGAAPFLPVLAVVVHAACAAWARGRRVASL